ncbi:hypothetical protein E2P81_ATG07912 [Venturia nashicola]|nr:hypothetical protein E2P81_ATG07912 [Venturia nashicola]
MLRIRKKVAKRLEMMRSSASSIPVYTDPSKWEDRGAPHCCWLNHQVDGDGSFQVTAYLGPKVGSWYMNFGTANLLIRGLLTKKQKNGILLHNWDLSHLCGNWRCMNHRHHFVESKTDNLRRKICFRRPEEPCPHDPPCLVWKQECDGSHHSPNAKRFRKYPSCFKSLVQSKEENLTAMAVTVSTEESEQSVEESEQSIDGSTESVEEQQESGWELDILSVEQTPVSELEMTEDNWSEVDRFWNRSRFEQDPKYLDERRIDSGASSPSSWPSLIDLY